MLNRPKRVRPRTNKYFCVKCHDTAYFFECRCGCGLLVSRRGKNGNLKYYIAGHGSKGKKPHNYLKGRRYHITSKGYVRVTLDDGSKQFEHRFVWESHYNCCIMPDWHIHHYNHDTLDNRIQNLEPRLLPDHVSKHRRENYLNTQPHTRVCCLCGSSETYINPTRNLPIWFKHDSDTWRCKKCDDKIRWQQTKRPSGS